MNLTKGISLVLCSYNGRKRLKPTLDHLLRQQCRPDLKIELIFVDNRSSDDTLGFIQSYLAANDHNFCVKLLHESRPGKAYAIERAYDAATYDYVITCDDDNWLEENYFQTAFDLMEQLPTVGLLGGRTIGAFESDPPDWFNKVSTNYVVGEQVDQEGFFEDKKYYVWGAGMVLRRSIWVFLRSHGFEFITGKNVNKAVGEDAELSILVKFLGYRFYYSRNLVLQHSMPAHRLTWQKCIDMFRGFGYTAPYFDLYKYCVKIDVLDAGQIKSYRRRTIFQGLYNLIKMILFSGLKVLLPGKYATGSWIKLRYEMRLAYLKEIVFNKEGLSKWFSISSFVAKLKAMENRQIE